MPGEGEMNGRVIAYVCIIVDLLLIWAELFQEDSNYLGAGRYCQYFQCRRARTSRDNKKEITTLKAAATQLREEAGAAEVGPRPPRAPVPQVEGEVITGTLANHGYRNT